MTVKEVYLDGSLKSAQELTEDSGSLISFLQSTGFMQRYKGLNLRQRYLNHYRRPYRNGAGGLCRLHGFCIRVCLMNLSQERQKYPLIPKEKLMTTINRLNDK